MIFLVVIAFILIASVTIYQYSEQNKDYHAERMERKEEQIKQSIDLTLQKTTYPVTTENLPHIFKDEIYEIAIVQNINFNIYDLEGQLLKSSRPKFEVDSISKCLEAEILNRLGTSPSKRIVEQKMAAGFKYQASYTFITDNKFKPIGILNLPYFEDNSFNDKELKEILLRLTGAYLLLLLIAIALSYFMSKFITRSLQTISDRLNQTDITKRNEKIFIKNPSEEIGKLITSYNQMIDELEISAAKLAKGEREQAWREMAKQVAHEIKNPLTPMRLSVQNFERRFDPNDPDILQKVSEYSKTLIQQIDTMSSIASAFSNFAQMPAQQNETLDVVKIVKLAVDIFNENYIEFSSNDKEVITVLDRTQLIRVVTNLVKNATQAVTMEAAPRVLVTVFKEEGWVCIRVADNGVGISEEMKDRIFEPKFTTKTSGMGLGLGMVKNIVETYKGSIQFESHPDSGTVFTVRFPIEFK
ncbi:two-component sensor histidine kinase [Arenibacter sp. H213]|uniref:histidine kinase n=1 Tax=Arenibacter antarcticus TaxID=2040469 RepID=A0ABW5VB46_9FLAO|nr:ATP-binding protein [Arenibacter sp. H213]MCM4167979.1 two-component sensor histidine kinase [Arenibacter sp. H213]